MCARFCKAACHSNPCLNGGTCVDYWHSPGYYYCHCDWNFSGHNCEYYVSTTPEVSPTPAGQCASNEFQCANGYECIWGNWYCDFIVDCGDGSDEYNCHGASHSP
ncbi:EGF-like repeat and discoidin I-like domain-containing protein 3 [Petromyzon marinus]|uniref:EGF-like repeat and discoidin I-like domain-containing protein 3 n=1 Tax=Petromyzon marinus TaxID=7757 RepID=UPI003F705FF6